MTTSSTAMVLVGPAGVGSFNDRLWRVNPNGSQLVEGGTNGPYFLVRSGEQEFPLHLEGTTTEEVVAGFVFLLALLVKDEHCLGLLRTTHNLVGPWGEDRVAQFWEIAPDVENSLVTRLKPLCRIGIVILDDRTIFSTEVFEALQALGLDIVRFEPTQEFLESEQTT